MMSDHKRKTPPVEGGVNNQLASGLRIVANNSWTQQQAAIAVLTRNDPPLTAKAGQFLGQCAVGGDPLTEKQAAWFAKLLEKAGLPQIGREA